MTLDIPTQEKVHCPIGHNRIVMKNTIPIPGGNHTNISSTMLTSEQTATDPSTSKIKTNISTSTPLTPDPNTLPTTPPDTAGVSKTNSAPIDTEENMCITGQDNTSSCHDTTITTMHTQVTLHNDPLQQHSSVPATNDNQEITDDIYSKELSEWFDSTQEFKSQHHTDNFIQEVISSPKSNYHSATSSHHRKRKATYAYSFKMLTVHTNSEHGTRSITPVNTWNMHQLI
jgi:hypothetical protein